ncbi:MAG: type IV pilin protein [Candidatus Sumerlaeia bacterium]
MMGTLFTDRGKAFTLIELLIVVAIIAILACRTFWKPRPGPVLPV